MTEERWDGDHPAASEAEEIERMDRLIRQAVNARIDSPVVVGWHGLRSAIDRDIARSTATLRSLIEQAQWVADGIVRGGPDSGEEVGVCPWCDGEEPPLGSGHASTCPAALAMGWERRAE